MRSFKSGSRTLSVFLCLALLLIGGRQLWASDTSPFLPELEITRVSDTVFSAIGATAAPSRENFGHNNNLTFIIAGDGVVVVNGGDNALLAAALHRAIRERTDKPVRYVINENGQGHAFLGNSYWSELGVPIIAQRLAIEEIQAHGERSLAQMRERMGASVDSAKVVLPDIAVEDSYILDLEGQRIELRRFGRAHSPGDLSVWLPEQRLLIAGDIAFHERLLGIFPDSDVDAWIDSFDVMATLEPEKVIPGHGGPTDIDTIRYYTQGYLKFLRDEVEAILDDDGDLSDAYEIDQSAYSDLDTFEELARKNAGRLFRQMEEKLF
ncbi:MBL fold metallo-hydrolase [Congregibacter litoralis]|uniref:Zn-dependent hydrolase n=1 Tax=Congregibacter litoralis KT71 TaxID=314285 RepID=A4A7L1_9GAMM|nr:MBL fold metallo-hydrolase [Congregibacter litoralis]EAQ98280.2 Zn-dependent hydrolase [Congregibacter litoralis KT71]